MPHTEELFATSKAVVDYCRKCKRKVVTKKDLQTQRIDNKQYLKTHKRDFLQPHGKNAKLFEKEYGKFDSFEQDKKIALERAKAISDERTEKSLADIDREESSSNRNIF